MASAVLMMLGGAAANAAAFTLAGKLTHSSDSKRHNLEMERIAKDHEKWNEERVNRLDYINQTLRRQNHASKTFKDLEEAGQAYFQMTGTKLPALRAEPRLPLSREHKDAELGVIVGIMGLAGFMIYKFM